MRDARVLCQSTTWDFYSKKNLVGFCGFSSVFRGPRVWGSAKQKCGLDLLSEEGRDLGGSILIAGSHSPGGSTITSSRNSSIPASRSCLSLALYAISWKTWTETERDKALKCERDLSKHRVCHQSVNCDVNFKDIEQYSGVAAPMRQCEPVDWTVFSGLPPQKQF